MAKTIEKTEQAENTKVESTDNPVEDKQEQTESVYIDDADKKEFLQNFITGNDDIQSIEEAKVQDKINMLEAKIQDIKAEKTSQNDTIKACKAVIDSNTYPRLNPIISSFSAHLEKLDKKKDKKIVKKEKQLKTAQRKLKKLQCKQKRSKLLKNFIFSMVHNSSDKQSAYINAMQALREDSLGRADKQLDKVESKLNKLNGKLNSSTFSEVDKLKIKAQIKKVESKRDKLIARINNLNELEQELNKLAKIELVDDKIDELRNTAVETAEKAAMEGNSVSETIDNVAENSSEVIKEILEPDRVQEVGNDKMDEQNKQSERQEEPKPEETEIQVSNENNLENTTEKQDNSRPQKADETGVNKKESYNKRSDITQKHLCAIASVGIPVTIMGVNDTGFTIAYAKKFNEKLDNVIKAVNTQVQGKPMTR